jgi:hypothetical protein
MLPKIINSLLYAVVATLVYFISANIGYYYINRQSMFADIYFYEWLEYVIVAGIIMVCSVAVELFRNRKQN